MIKFNDIEQKAFDCGFTAYEDISETTYYANTESLAKFVIAIVALVMESSARIAEGYNFGTTDGKAISSIIRHGGQA